MDESQLAEQGTEAWRRERAGCATASRFADILTGGKGRDTYVMEKVCERLTGEPMPEFFAYATQWGKDAEPFARADYQIDTGRIVTDSGFVKHATIPWVGASPDGLIGEDGIIEIKSPHNSLVHLGTWKNGMPREHKAQVQGVLWVTGRQWCDFISFDPRMPANLRLYVERVQRDEAYIARIAESVHRFLAEVNTEVASYQAMGEPA